MKSFYLIVFACFLSSYAQSQTKDSLAIEKEIEAKIKVETYNVNTNLPVVSNALQIIKQLKTTEKDPTKDWIAEHWNTKVFNPYKKVKKQYPLQIKFDDSTYASPITRNKVVTSRYGWRNRRAHNGCLLYTSPSPRDAHESRMPSSA